MTAKLAMRAWLFVYAPKPRRRRGGGDVARALTEGAFLTELETFADWRVVYCETERRARRVFKACTRGAQVIQVIPLAELPRGCAAKC